MNTNGQLKRSKLKRRRKQDFVEDYVRNSTLFFGETPTEEDINRTWDHVKNIGKRKRVKRNSEPDISKEEFVVIYVRNSQLLGETPTEEDIDRTWYLIESERQYKKTRGEKEQAAFLQFMEQEITTRYSPAAIEERRLRKEMEVNNSSRCE